MFDKLRHLFKSQQQESDSGTANNAPVATVSVSDRASQVYGEEKVNRQRLYEKWSCKDYWELRTEGIPLLLGVEPYSSCVTDDVTSQSMQELWQHASDCVNKKLLVVLNPDMPADEWRVTPSDLYCWATVSRVSVPQELSALMDFVLQTIKTSPAAKEQQAPASNDSQHDARYLRHCEITLGAALSLLVNSPDACKSSRGRVKAALIAAEILGNSEAWFGKDEPLLAQSAMEDLINRYVAKSRLPVG